MREPMALYWHARSATRMPLLHFLGMYQVLEFFFPRYSNAVLRERIAAVLHDPGFDPRGEEAITALAALASRGGGKRGWGDERAQLRGTLKACIEPTWLRQVIGSQAEYARALCTKNALSDDALDLGASDLVTKVADRLYALRCRIVHTKASLDENDEDPLFPASEEVALLDADLALVRLLAERVLIKTRR